MAPVEIQPGLLSRVLPIGTRVIYILLDRRGGHPDVMPNRLLQSISV